MTNTPNFDALANLSKFQQGYRTIKAAAVCRAV
jgi:hypothetical protein